jgi:hypothetical protein
MTTRIKERIKELPAIAVHVIEPGVQKQKSWVRCQIGQNVEFSTERLETYFFAQWEPVIFDALLVAAAVEFADRTKPRVAMRWEREIELHIPVHDPDRWNAPSVRESLLDALNFVTGDRWEVNFYRRTNLVDPPQQGKLTLPEGVTAVLPFSDGLDSRIVAGLMAREMGDNLVRVRLGSKTADAKCLGQRHPFTSVPYRVRPTAHNSFRESSARSRGFKFALLSGLAAYLGKAGQVIVPESGQGALGPAMVTVGQAYEDYRSHPLFTARMERFLMALIEHKVQFRFPRLWHTKAETLKEFIKQCEDAPKWLGTWSCWQQNRQVSVEKKKRQCGICAACMLRRMSVHAAGLSEPNTAYVWENLGASAFRQGAAASFPGKKITEKLRQYAIAGCLHLDHLAALLESPANQGSLELQAFQLGRVMDLPEPEVLMKLHHLLNQHASEWKGFVHSLGENSFVADWAIYGNA